MRPKSAGTELPKGKTYYLRIGIGVLALVALIALAITYYQRARILRALPQTTGQVPFLRLQDLYSASDKPLTIQLKGIEIATGQYVNIPAVIHQSKSRLNQMKQAVLSYLQGPHSGKVQVAGPAGIRLNEIYLTPDGTAVVDLTLAEEDIPSFGFWEETLFVRGLLFVLNNHFLEVKRVRLLMDGLESGTLAGHYALGSPASSYVRPDRSTPND